ncbi:MAG: hypothetical protein V1779_05990 [bacterium]
MKTFLIIIQILVAGAVIITAVRMYFTVNKLWKRKSDQEVCNSISIFAYVLALAVHTPFMIKFALIDKNYVMATNDGLQVLAYILVIIIGTGFWVRANKRTGFFTLVKKSLRLESKESGHLMKSLIRPSGAQEIIDILRKIARLDNDLSESEIKIIKDFAKNWDIEISSMEEWKASEQSSLMDVRESVEKYLNLSPPVKQASELLDLFKLIVKADNVVTIEEELFIAEATGLINSYVHKEDNPKMYQVLLVPQKKKKIKAMAEIFPNNEMVDRRGGKVLIQGKYYSKEFAEEVCKNYMELGIFSIWEEIESIAA